jgi:hypothetical protein
MRWKFWKRKPDIRKAQNNLIARFEREAIIHWITRYQVNKECHYLE